MKIRSSLVTLVILAQLSWLGYNYVVSSGEIDAAPHILVNAHLDHSSIRMDDSYFTIPLEQGNKHLGQSIRWEIYSSESPARLENVTDAVLKEGITLRIIKGDRSFSDIICLNSTGESIAMPDFVAIWSKGENGLWDYRLEVKGSSADAPGKDEIRTPASIRSWARTDTNDDVVEAKLHVQLFHRNTIPSYKISSDSAARYRRHVEDKDGPHSLFFTLELALPNGERVPLATQAYLGGKPWGDAVHDLMTDSDTWSETPAAEQPETPAAEQPETPAAEQPETPAAEQPETPATEQPETPATEQPETPAAEQPETPAAEQPETPAAEQPETPATEQPETPAADQPETPAADQPETPAAEQPETPAAEQPETPATEQPETPAADQPETPAAEQPETPAAEQPETPAAEQPEAPAAEQPETPATEQPEAPAAEQPETPATEQPETPATEQPEAPAAEQPETPAAEQPETPAAE